MRLVRALRGEHDLGIGSDVDLTVPVLEVDQRQPANLSMVDTDRCRCVILARSSD